VKMNNMLKKTIALALLVVSQWIISAQNYSVSYIPDSLKTNADVVVINDDTSVEILNQRSMNISHRSAVTIFNKNAEEWASPTIGYDKHQKINNVTLIYYDALGNVLKKVKRSEFMDYAAVDGISLYSDDRVIHFNYTPITYPFTMVYEYEISTSNTAFIPSWFPIEGYDTGVINSSYTLIFPKEFKVQQLEKNILGFNIKSQVLPQRLTYTLSNTPPLKYEEMSPSFRELVPYVNFALNKFHLAGVDGQAESWDEFGIWMQDKLLASRNNLSEETKTQIRNMVKGVTDPKERAKIVYEYVQNKTRYISVQIGVGGWMPMYTDDVDRLAYGDCKALTFYTKSLLEEVGIPAHYSLVYAGDVKQNIEKDLISAQGNHAFLILPMEKDSIFLECTNQKIPFGIKSNFTEDREVLSLTPQGGKIIHTPAYLPEENRQDQNIHYSINDNGTLSAQIEIKSYGNQYSNHLQYFDGKQPNELDELFKNHYDHINNISIESIKVNNNRELKRYEENIILSATNYAVINPDGSIIFSPNAFNRLDYVPQKVNSRKTPFEIRKSFKDVDQYKIQLPENYKVTDLPASVTVETDFGNYSFSIEKETEQILVYKRSVIVYNGIYPKEKYEEYRKFRKDLKKYDEMKILLQKK
jgi:transglutaminase-like putative cysteine protease